MTTATPAHQVVGVEAYQEALEERNERERLIWATLDRLSYLIGAGRYAGAVPLAEISRLRDELRAGKVELP